MLFFLSSRQVNLKLLCDSDHGGSLVKVQILIQEAQGRALVSAFPTDSQVMPVLRVHRLQLQSKTTP